MIEVKDLTVGYKSALIKIESTSFDAGKLYLLSGRNGSGKSTLLKTLGGIIKPLSGSFKIDGVPSSSLSQRQFAKKVCYIGNRVPIADGMRLIDIVAHGRIPHLSLGGRLKTDDITIINHAIESIGITDICHQQASMSSDGELQKAFIASGLAQETPIILLDEPTAHLDLASRREFWAKLQTLCHSQNKCIVVASHNIDMAELFADEMLILYQNSLNDKSSTNFNEALAHLKGEKWEN